MPEKKIKICYTSQHACIRTIKIAKALMATGKYSIHGVSNQVSWGTQYLDSYSFYHNMTQFDNLIRDIDADIFIHANEPNHQIQHIRKVRPDAKIVLDAHDLDSVRQGIIPLDEFKAITNCDGIIFVSKEMQDYICDLHRDQLRNKPSVVLEHYCSQEFIDKPLPPASQRRGLVYEGGAQSPPYKDNQFRYRHLYPIFQQLVKQGHEVHIMAGNGDVTRTYTNIGAYVYSPEVYDKLMTKLTLKKYGLCTFNNGDLSQMQVNLTRTNKEQEYLACGLPIIVFGAPATAKYVKEHEVGLVFDKLEDITPEILEKEYPRVKANVDKLRPSLSMEKHIHVLDKFLQNFIKR